MHALENCTRYMLLSQSHRRSTTLRFTPILKIKTKKHNSPCFLFVTIFKLDFMACHIASLTIGYYPGFSTLSMQNFNKLVCLFPNIRMSEAFTARFYCCNWHLNGLRGIKALYLKRFNSCGNEAFYRRFICFQSIKNTNGSLNVCKLNVQRGLGFNYKKVNVL